MKLEEKKAKVEKKLAETEKKLEELKNNLVETRKRKIALMANLIMEESKEDEKELADINKIISGLESDIKVFPDIIVILKGKIEDINKDIAKRDSLIAQKKREKEEKELLEMCQKFYKSLTETKALNDEMRKIETVFKDKWGSLPGGSGITIGSVNSLKALYETIQKEILGQGRQPIPFGNMPEFRI